MIFELSDRARGAGYRLEAFETIASTNAHALAQAAAGERGPVWFVTDEQVAGRGRRGRPWATPKGNLAASLLLAVDGTLEELAVLGFVASIALSRALEIAAPELGTVLGVDGVDGRDADTASAARVELKWPNDVLIGGAKLAGILLETARLPDAGYAVCIGFGVNVVSHPQDTPYRATHLRARGYRGDAADLLVALSDAWLGAYRLWDRGAGIGAIRAQWLERAAGLNAPVAIRTQDGVLRGTLETLDEKCRLVIRHDNGSTRVITAGDVHFGAVAGDSPRAP
ncbi:MULTISPECIES: biotin--[acetyl-CoA-carboxylase] ligase [unclassified Roseitalea]|uniref:biotin--[acetyl-CoA-carboxylase] ligase n=1 Tax=unclassified Roseitalea TaxID=2639107 RepID=UPI00273F9C90|nr:MULTISPECIES: biotin--[acetyl-CoA-carboxylase] ligase [unclassified Roseitalea]